MRILKKIIAVCLVITVLLSSSALAENLPAMTDEELLELHQNVLNELERRGLPADPAADVEGTAVTRRMAMFFDYWSNQNLGEMLALCSSVWKATVENPRMELFRILANRTPQDLVIEAVNAVAGEGPGGLPWYQIRFTSALDRNNGTGPERYRFGLLLGKEADGLWYIDPTGLETSEKVDETLPAETTAEPEGGAPSASGEDPFRFATFNDAAKAAAGEYTVSSEGYAVAVIERDGCYFRAVTLFDERAKELYAAYLDKLEPETGNNPDDEWSALYTYLSVLPVDYTEELTVVPFTQEELDAMAGKTLEEVMSEPWELQMRHNPEDAGAGKDVAFPMVRGFCEYELVINEPFEVYQERLAGDRYDPVTAMSLKNYLDLTVKSVKYTGVSNNMTNLQYQTDGTLKRDMESLTEGYDYDLMVEIADYLASVWENGEPDQEAKEAMIADLTEQHPEAADMIRQIVESFH